MPIETFLMLVIVITFFLAPLVKVYHDLRNEQKKDDFDRHVESTPGMRYFN
jgi:hypothetical protein